MTAVYSTRFIGARVASVGSETYNPGAGAVTVIRDIQITSTGTAAAGGWVSVWVSGSAQTILLQFENLAPQSYLHWEGRVVVAAGETLELEVTAGQVDGFVSGYTLS